MSTKELRSERGERKSFAFLLAVMLAAACGGGAQTASAFCEPPPAAASAPVVHACPLSVAGTSATIEDVPGGARMVFVTAGDVVALRTQVEELAELLMEMLTGDDESAPIARLGLALNDERAASDASDAADAADAAGPDDAPLAVVAEVEDIEGGAMLTLIVDHEEAALDLRVGLRAFLHGMEAGACPVWP